MTETQNDDRPAPLIDFDGRKLVAVLVLGAVIGLVVWGLAQLIDRYVLAAFMCAGDDALQCAAGWPYAEAAAHIIGAGIGLFFLVKLQVFRPLLVVLGVLIALWGVIGMASLLPWYGVGGMVIALYAIGYGLFAWIARLRPFWLVVVLYAVLIVAVRAALSL